MARLKSLRAPVAWIGGGALALWACLGIGLGVGFVNYDTAYSLVWGQQLARGQLPAYRLPIAPTPHPLTELLGVGLAPLGPAGDAGDRRRPGVRIARGPRIRRLPARRGLVLVAGRAGGGRPDHHAGPDPQLRGPGLRRHPLRRPRPDRPARRDPPAAGRLAGARPAGGGRPDPPGGLAPRRRLLALPHPPPSRRPSSSAWPGSRRSPRSSGRHPTWRSPATHSGR